VLLAAKILRGIHYHKPLDLIVASLLLGILNAVLRPVLLFLALPLVIVTLGLFIFVINAVLLYFVANLLRPHFYVDSFWDAFWGALLIGVVSLVLNQLCLADEVLERGWERSFHLKAGRRGMLISVTQL
jgi:putative membrane protein